MAGLPLAAALASGALLWFCVGLLAGGLGLATNGRWLPRHNATRPWRRRHSRPARRWWQASR